MPGRFTRSFLTNKAMQSLCINQGPTVTFMWHAKSQAKPQTYSDSHCFIIKPTHMRILALPEASLHCVGMKQPGKKPAVPGCSNWTSLELRLPKCRDDPRRVVWAANRLEEYQKLTTSQRDMTEKSFSEQAQSARMSAWRESVLAADAKKAGSASEDTSHPQTSILHWEAGLKPLYVRYIRVCDALDGRF